MNHYIVYRDTRIYTVVSNWRANFSTQRIFYFIFDNHLISRAVNFVFVVNNGMKHAAWFARIQTHRQWNVCETVVTLAIKIANAPFNPWEFLSEKYRTPHHHMKVLYFPSQDSWVIFTQSQFNAVHSQDFTIILISTIYYYNILIICI